MIFELSRFFFKRAPKRRRPSDQEPTGGLQSFFNKPAWGMFYWVLVWLAAFLLTLSANGREASAPFLTQLQKLCGDGLILFLGLICTAVLFRFAYHGGGALGGLRVAPPNSATLLFLLITLLNLGAIKWLLWMDFVSFPWLAPLAGAFLPLALAPMLLSILINPLVGMVAGFWVSYAAGVLADYRISVLLTGLLVTVVVGRFTRAVRSRAMLLRIGLWAGLAGGAGVIGFAAAGLPGYELVIPQLLASIAGGVFAALLVMLLLPFVEIAFGISTDISLLELSDLEHPLLKRLAIEAPGTYHHSLMVANLTQAAVTAIGGNALRAGICAYFHDIGKLLKPSFFSENIQYGDNPHDELSPSMSSLVIIAHVKEGVGLALRHKLPRPVVEAIQQHHGSGLVFYFYHKASVQQGEARAEAAALGVPEQNFRYPGPKPQSREIAVLSLADAIEAASRSLEKVSPGALEDLVSEVIDSKLRDGQLDECDLAMAEINTIQRVLTCTLGHMLHRRIGYPSDENNRPKSPETPSAQPA
ncbi:MAG: HDIG domain-containing protein [Lentisphaerae bacterium]|nr:HDIG domain-containing protein [Lentisphaerota bacterium]